MQQGAGMGVGGVGGEVVPGSSPCPHSHMGPGVLPHLSPQPISSVP